MLLDEWTRPSPERVHLRPKMELKGAEEEEEVVVVVVEEEEKLFRG